ncbi:MAG: NADH:ubiquinone reductase (Na(+)-transporting) subunit C [Gammaproteobacteria bacterium]|jgi:Na+-transporting NADH:ubiquinone oxidoreductase subunit C
MTAGAESPVRTIAFAASVALVCSLIVSTAVYLLRPIALAYEAIDLDRAVLEAAGLLPDDADGDDRAVVRAFLDLEARAVDLDAGAFTDAVDAAGADFRAALDEPAKLVPIPAGLDVAGLETRPRYAPVYLLRADRRIVRIVLPLYARGMWSTIHGVIALDSDFSTIAGIAFYAHGETPGIGDRIERDDWRAQWVGRRLYDDTGELRFRLGVGAAARTPEYGVDSITGATVTTSAVGDAITYWFSEDGYEPFLRRLREGGD